MKRKFKLKQHFTLKDSLCCLFRILLQSIYSVYYTYNNSIVMYMIITNNLKYQFISIVNSINVNQTKPNYLCDKE